MNSSSNEPPGNIADLRDSIAQNAESLNPDHEIEGLRTRLDEVELLIEEFAQARALQGAVSDYVADLRAELDDIKRFRWWVTLTSGLMSISLFCLIIYCAAYSPEWFVNLDASAKVPFLIACGGGSVFLMSILLRGVYRSRSDRNKDEILPEHFKQIRDAVTGPVSD